MTSDREKGKNSGDGDHTDKRGFASMDEDKQREIASKGGKAAHEKGTAHEFLVQNRGETMSILAGETRISDDHDCRVNVDGDEYAVLILSVDGMIHDWNKAGESLLGDVPKNLPKLHISKLLPKLAKINLLKERRANPYLRFLSRIGHPFEVVSMAGKRFAGRIFFIDVENCGLHQLIVIIHPISQENSLH